MTDVTSSGPARNPSAPASAHRLPEIDWLRALAILYVAGFWHMSNYAPRMGWSHAPVFYSLTVLALALFVLASGYLLGAVRMTGAADLGRFWRRRLLRLYPPYLLAVLVFAAMGMLDAPVWSSALLAGMLTDPPRTLWFVNMIVLFYALAPLWLALLPRPLAYWTVTAALWLVLAVLSGKGLLADGRLAIYLPVFAAGIALRRAEAAAARPPAPRRAGNGSLSPETGAHGRALWLPALLALCLPGLWLGLQPLAAVGLPADMTPWQSLWALAGSVTLFRVLRGRLPDRGWIGWVAVGSYMLYLFHRPVYEAVLWLGTGLGLDGGAARLVLLYAVALPLALWLGARGQAGYDRLVGAMADRRRGRCCPGP